jgi:adenylate cyclase
MMAEQPNRFARRLAAVLAADVAGYSRLIGLDEEGTLTRLGAHRRELIDRKVAVHDGRIVKTTGDGFLAEFASVLAGVRCASEIQAGMSERNAAVPPDSRIEFRIGIHQGDLVVEDGDIFGDGVNIAARLEGLAEPGGICVSARVYEDAAGRLDIAFEDLGERQLKNIARGVRAYRVVPQPVAGAMARPWTALPLPDKPSIAVLAFANMSGDPAQEFFADGIAEDIITTLSKSRFLFVIARNSSFTYKGRAVAVKVIGRELGVRFVLEGSVRKAGNRVRVTAQLVEAATGGHLWAERYDRDLADIFAVQDEITQSVSGAIQPALERGERERVSRRPPESLDAWESYHRGMWHFAKYEEAELGLARTFFERAVALDPGFAAAYSALALVDIREGVAFRPDLRAENMRHALDLAKRAVAFDPTDAAGHAALAASLWQNGRHAESVAEADLAVSLDPNSAQACGTQGGARMWAGRHQEAIEPLKTAMRLSPFDPDMPHWLHFTGRALYGVGNYAEAITVSRQICRSYPNMQPAWRTLLAALGQTRQVQEAEAVMQEAVARFGEDFGQPLRLAASSAQELRPEDREHLVAGLRKAGLTGG